MLINIVLYGYKLHKNRVERFGNMTHFLYLCLTNKPIKLQTKFACKPSANQVKTGKKTTKRIKLTTNRYR